MPWQACWVELPPVLAQRLCKPSLDGATIVASQRAVGEDPTVIEGDQQREKEVWVAAGQVLVQMHVTDWAAAQKGRPWTRGSFSVVRG